jgi:NAD(P)-dependent dehydrogenase (short-subunit alcohol dehydrogenase family)
MTLHERVAVVTGATKGVGRGIAHELATAGARVFITGRSAVDGRSDDGRLTTIRCDHQQDDQVDRAFRTIVDGGGGIDILVNNVWGGYDRMMDGGEFTWPRRFWEQPLWR